MTEIAFGHDFLSQVIPSGKMSQELSHATIPHENARWIDLEIESFWFQVQVILWFNFVSKTLDKIPP